MIEVSNVPYLTNTIYIYENGIVIGVYHTDTKTMIVNDNSGYTEEELIEMMEDAVKRES